jgi:hypothetical protein
VVTGIPESAVSPLTFGASVAAGAWLFSGTATAGGNSVAGTPPPVQDIRMITNMKMTKVARIVLTDDSLRGCLGFIFYLRQVNQG